MTHRFHQRPFIYGLFFVISVILSSCSDDDNSGPIVAPPGQDGYFIVNEGGFNNGNTTLSYYDRSQDTVLNDIFEATASRPLGDQTQSMTVFDDRGFIVVQNSAKVEVIDRTDFTSVATISEGIVSPRYFLGIDATKGYLTDWGADGVSGTVKVIDLTTYEVTKTIPVGQGPNELVLLDGQVFVANYGGFGQDSTVVVLDAQIDEVTDTIIVGYNPKSLVVDAVGTIWVAGEGAVAHNEDFSAIDKAASTPGFIAQLSDGTVTHQWSVDQINAGPYAIVADNVGTKLYYRYDDAIYALLHSATRLPGEPFITGNFYGLAIDPISGEVLASDPMNYSSEGIFFRYSPAGELIKSYSVGIAPNGFAF